MTALKDRVRSSSFLVIPLLLYVILAGSLFLSYLPPQTDEELFSEPAFNLASEGKLVSHIVVGMDQGVFWQPPLYFLTLAAVVKCAGYSLPVVRGFSMALGGVVSVNPLFILYSRMGRMDTLCLVLILLTLYLIVRASEDTGYWTWLTAGIGTRRGFAYSPVVYSVMEDSSANRPRP